VPLAKPQRIVSLDLCTDQLLIELADPQRIAAITHLAGDPSVSAIPEKARGFAVTRGAAEDVLAHDPDLILAGPFGVSPTISLLRRLQRQLVVVPLAEDLDGVRTAVRTVAQAIGEVERGEAMLADFDRALAALAPPPNARRPRALIYQVNSIVAGPGSLADAVLRAAGLDNMAGVYRLTRKGQVPLERLLAEPPELLVLASRSDEYRTAAADNLRHPALISLRREHASLELPWQLWLCGTPHILAAIDKLAAARRQLAAPRP
jgi:iron complex transport system substrate-binding protein